MAEKSSSGDQRAALLKENARRRRRDTPFFRTLVEQADHVVWLLRLRPSLSFEYVSPAMQDLLGFSPTAFYADASFHERLIHPADRARANHAMGLSGGSHTITFRCRHLRGHYIAVEHWLSPIHDDEGQLIGLQGVCRRATPSARTATPPPPNDARAVTESFLKTRSTILHHGDLITICSTCSAVRDNDDRWEPVARVLRRALSLRVSHGLCPRCSQAMWEQLQLTEDER